MSYLNPPPPEPTAADRRKCERLVRKHGFSQGHDWARTDSSNFRYCRRCHEPGWDMPVTEKENASA